MKIGAYQFAVTKDISRNLNIMEQAITQATQEKIRLLVFPECALTGYPPRDFESTASVNFEELTLAQEQLRKLAIGHAMYVLAGTITKEEGKFYNSAMLFTPQGETRTYHKRALWGWDRENFSVGSFGGVFDIEGWRVGVRICFEVRFPEFFRELYREHTDLNIIMFYDVSDDDDVERYEMIKAHIQTRAVENVTYTLSVDAIEPYQTAPTALYDRSGRLLKALERNKEQLLVYDLERRQPDFGECGRRQVSDWLLEKER